MCESDNSSIAQVFEAGVRRWGKPAVEVEQAVLDEYVHILRESQGLLDESPADIADAVRSIVGA